MHPPPQAKLQASLGSHMAHGEAAYSVSLNARTEGALESVEVTARQSAAGGQESSAQLSQRLAFPPAYGALPWARPAQASESWAQRRAHRRMESSVTTRIRTAKEAAGSLGSLPLLRVSPMEYVALPLELVPQPLPYLS